MQNMMHVGSKHGSQSDLWRLFRRHGAKDWLTGVETLGWSSGPGARVLHHALRELHRWTILNKILSRLEIHACT